MTLLNPDAQPVNSAFNHARRLERDLSEMLGLAKGMLADGVVNDQEAIYLRDWAARHPSAIGQWPLNLVFTRLNQFFTNGTIEDQERSELHGLLGQLVGGTASVLLGYEGATSLPLDVPPPPLRWGSREVYVFTGAFAYGPRHACEREVIRRGARCEPNITRRTTFLVIGTFGSRDWAHSSYGRKIQKAVTLRESKGAILIVGEDHWANSIGSAAAEGV